MKIQNLTIKLVGSEPDIIRKIQVPMQMNLHELHQLIQRAMPWDSSHMYEFHCQSKKYWREEADDFDEGAQLVTKKWSIERFLIETKAKKFHYLYDFGDHWDHLILVDKVEDPKPSEIYPKLLAAKGCCPPDDIGGIQHYKWALEIINDPDDENYEDTREWFDDDFDPNADVFPALEKKVAEFAQRYQKNQQ